MKRDIVYILAIVVVFVIGVGSEVIVHIHGIERGDRNYQTITIDSCEYLYKRSGYRESIAHKGNCKYCAQRDSINQH